MNNLKDADQILNEYSQPDSLVDEGNLFFAATEYKKAYEELLNNKGMPWEDYLYERDILQKQWSKDQEKLTLAKNQIEGIILCLKAHGTNINPQFLIEHYETILGKLK